MTGLKALLVMVPWWRSRQCRRGVRTCWECRAYTQWLARARGAEAVR